MRESTSASFLKSKFAIGANCHDSVQQSGFKVSFRVKWITTMLDFTVRTVSSGA